MIIFVHLSNTVNSYATRPIGVGRANACVKIPQNKQMVSVSHSTDLDFKAVVEFVFLLIGGG